MSNFSFFHCFLLSQINVSPFVYIFCQHIFFAAEFEEPKIGTSGEGLMYKDNSAHVSDKIGSMDASFTLLLNDKILDLSKLETFADKKINVTQKSKFLYERVEIIVDKGENASCQHFLLFRNVFKRASP